MLEVVAHGYVDVMKGTGANQVRAITDEDIRDKAYRTSKTGSAACKFADPIISQPSPGGEVIVEARCYAPDRCPQTDATLQPGLDHLYVAANPPKS